MSGGLNLWLVSFLNSYSSSKIKQHHIHQINPATPNYTSTSPAAIPHPTNTPYHFPNIPMIDAFAVIPVTCPFSPLTSPLLFSPVVGYPLSLLHTQIFHTSSPTQPRTLLPLNHRLPCGLQILKCILRENYHILCLIPLSAICSPTCPWLHSVTLPTSINFPFQNQPWSSIFFPLPSTYLWIIPT